ncbi:MAG: cupredoxin domain-containing protein [Nitrosomonas sp.]|nr:cupredoxin domain-containing protein [Nitrosomonas sp.]
MNKITTLILAVCLFALSGQVSAEEPVDHSDHMHHDDHNMDHSDHSGHDHSLHDDDHQMDDPSDHTMHHPEDDHSMHHGDHHHHDDGHIMDHEGGMIMGQNFDKLPSSCDSISEEIEITVRAGRQYAKEFPGTIFAFDKQEWHVKPCSKITWHFINEDDIRHQFMMHGLPRYLYSNGMFHLESTGPRTISGTLIVPASDETYLVHCDISQHMEKGMKAQLVVGSGSEDLPSIPGLTPYAFPDTYEAENLPQVSDDPDKDTITKQITDFLNDNSPISLMMFIGLVIGLLSMPLVYRVITLLRKKEPETTG